jgi:hypothetical protein
LPSPSVWNAELIRCPQFPTTLPTLDELIGRDGIDETNVAAPCSCGARAKPAGHGHPPRRAEGIFAGVRTAADRLEGARLAARFDAGLYESVQPMALPRYGPALAKFRPQRRCGTRQ